MLAKMARFKRCAFFVVFLIAVARCATGVTTTVPTDVTTTTSDVTTTSPDVTTTTSPGVTATVPTDVTTTTSDVTTTSPDVTTTTPDVTTISPGVTTTTTPGVTTTTPGVTTITVPTDVTTTTSDVTTATPDVTTTTSPGVTATVPTDVTTTTSDVTTTSPDVTTTTPDVTTISPGVTTTTTPGVTTTTPGVTTITVPTDVTTTTSDVTTAPPSTSDPCKDEPCGVGSTCQRRFNNNFTCLCLVGMNYDETEMRCAVARVFPGQLELTLKWNQNLTDKTSQCFQTQSERIINELKNIFNGTNLMYIKSTVLEFNPSEPVKMNLREINKTTATVENLFRLSSPATEGNVSEIVAIAISKGQLNATSFNATNLCDQNGCDGKTTNCTTGDDGLFSCPCRHGYITSEFSNKACFACPSGEWAFNDTNCELCGFGRSGFNCNEYWKLALVIVGSVLGVLLFLMAIVVGVLSRRPSRKSSKKTSGAEEDATTYYSHSLAKAPLINPNGPTPVAASNGFPKIPRATPTRDPLGGGHIEMTPNNGRLNAGPRAGHAANRDPYEQNRATTNLYVQNRDPYEQNRATTNPYVQNRDPYEQNRATTNPYVQNRDPYEQNQAYNNKKRGYTNSNYMHNDDRSY